MAVQVFKDGESKWIEPRSLTGYTTVGWSTEDPSRPRSKNPLNHIAQLGIDANTPPEEAEEIILGKMGIEV